LCYQCVTLFLRFYSITVTVLVTQQERNGGEKKSQPPPVGGFMTGIIMAGRTARKFQVDGSPNPRREVKA
jgi:hypothetical protein